MVYLFRCGCTVWPKVGRGQTMMDFVELGGLFLAAFGIGVLFGMKVQVVVAFFRGASDV